MQGIFFCRGWQLSATNHEPRKKALSSCDSAFFSMPPGLGHGDEEGEDGAYDGADPEALQGRGDAPLVSAPADDWRNEAANSRRQTQGDARSEADVFAEVCLSQDDDGTVSGEQRKGDGDEQQRRCDEVRTVYQEEHGRNHDQHGAAKDAEKAEAVGQDPAEEGDDDAHGKEDGQGQTACGRRGVQDVDPVEGNEGVTDRKADGTDEDDDG